MEVVPRVPAQIDLDDAKKKFIVNNVSHFIAVDMFDNISEDPAETIIQNISPAPAQTIYEGQPAGVAPLTLSALAVSPFQQVLASTTQKQAQAIPLPALQQTFATLNSAQEQLFVQAMAANEAPSISTWMSPSDWQGLILSADHAATLPKPSSGATVITISVPGAGSSSDSGAAPQTTTVEPTALANILKTPSTQEAHWIYGHLADKSSLLTQVRTASPGTIQLLLTQVDAGQADILEKQLVPSNWQAMYPLGVTDDRAPTPQQAKLLLSVVTKPAEAVKMFTNLKEDDQQKLVTQLGSTESQVLLDDYLTNAAKKAAAAGAATPGQNSDQIVTMLSTTNDATELKSVVEQLNNAMGQTKGAAPPTEGFEETLINGTADFLVNRARAEAEEIAIDRVLDTICAPTSGAPPLFPETCALSRQRARPTTLSVANTYQAMVLAIRDDLEYVPACIIYQSQHSRIGYQFQSVYEQNQNQVSLDWLLYGLAISGELNKTTDPSANGSMVALCSYTSADHFKGKMCGVVVPIMTYAAITRVVNTYSADSQNVLVQRILVNAFEQSFDDLAEANLFCQTSDSSKPCPLESDLKKWIEAPGSDNPQVAATIMNQIATIRSRIAATVKAYNQQLTGAHPPTHDDFAKALLAMSSSTFDAMYAATRLAGTSLGLPAANSRKLAAYVDMLDDLQGIYAATEAKEYSLALIKTQPIFDCLTSSTQPPAGNASSDLTKPEFCDDEWVSDKTVTVVVGDVLKVGGAMTAIADAKSSSDVASTLDQLASPLDAWKLRHEDSMVTINGYVGVSIGVAAYDVPQIGRVSDNFYSVFAPIGVSYSTPTKDDDCGAFGAFFELVDLGNLIAQPQDVSFHGGRIAGAVNSKLSKIFSPGAYLMWYPSRKYPLMLYAGYSRGPSQFREVDYDNPNMGTTYASRKYAISVGIAFDIVMYQL